MNAIFTVFVVDKKRILRDPFLLFMTIAPFIFAVVLRYALPYFNARFSDLFTLTEYYPLIIGLFTVTPALYIGAILALQLIEEQEDNVLAAVAVTPFNLQRYFAVRIASYSLIAFLIIGLVQHVVGLLPTSALEIWTVALVMSLQVPIMGFIVAIYANNQVEGMVALKGTSLLLIPPIAMYFVDDFWHLLCGILPGYWPIIAFFTAVKSPEVTPFYFIALIVGLIYQPLVIYLLYRKYHDKLRTAN